MGDANTKKPFENFAKLITTREWSFIKEIPLNVADFFLLQYAVVICETYKILASSPQSVPSK